MPEFLMFISHDEDEAEAKSPAEIGAAYAKVGAWWEEHERAGRFVPGAGRRLHHTRKARRIRTGRGAVTVTDGPFIETKETVGGFGILTVPDMAAAVEIAKSWPGLPVTLELRPVRTD